MKNRKKFILLIIILLILVFNVIVSYYKFTRNKNTAKDLIVLNIKNNPIISNLKYQYNDVKERYSEDFPYNIKFSNNNGKFSGILNLKSEELTLYDNYNKKTIKLIEENVSKVVICNIEKFNKLCLYALTNNNDLYYLLLETGNLDDIVIKKFDLKVDYITDLNLYKLNDIELYTVKNKNNILDFKVVVYSKNNKYYLMPYEIPYEKDMIIANDKYVIYKNNVTTTDGRILKDEKGNYILTKYIIYVDFETNIFPEKPEEIIITKDNRVVYVIDDKLIINNKKIIKFSLLKDEVLSTFEIIYEDETKEIFKGYYDKDFNKFDNN